MDKMIFKYHKGSEHCAETVEFDILKKDGSYITTCVVSAQLLSIGVTFFPCGDGTDFKLNREQQLKALLFLQEERRKLTEGIEVKTYKGWGESGLPTFEDYCQPGDTVDEDMVDYFMNCLPPVSMSSVCAQAGEAYSHEADDDGQHRATYTTFSRLTASSWRFEGYCFKGSTNNRVQVITSLERQIREIQREAQSNG